MSRLDWTGDWDDCFHHEYDGDHYAGITDFAHWANAQPFDFYWPDYHAAPWHIQCVTKIGDDDVEMNFWPHKSKAQFKYEKALEPLSAFVDELVKRQVEAEREEDFDVVE